MADIIVDKYELDLSGFEGSVSKVIEGYDAINQQTKSAAGQNPFKKQADDVLKFNNQLRSGSQLLTAMTQNEKALQAEVKRLAAEYLKAAAAQQKAQTPVDLKKSQEEIKKLRGEIDALTKQIDKANDQLDKLSKKRKTEPDKKTGGSVLGKVTGTVGELATGAGLALGGAEIIRRAVTDSAEYGRKLSELSALTGAAGKDLAFLDQQAQAIEQDTGVVASTILDTFKAVGSIQPALLSNKQALADTTKEVVALAQAGSITLPEAAQATLGALNQFGEGADQAGRYVNVLAAGALKGASEIADTTQALQDSGTAMKAAGLSFEQGNALIQSLAGVMIKGSEAGTGLRNVLLKLETDTDKNLRPSIVGLDKALENAAKKYDTTTELTKVFGTENILVARRVLDTRNEISSLTKELTGTDVAYEQQRVNLNNLATDLDKAGSATTGFFRTLGQSQDGLLRRLTQGYTLFLQNLSNAKSVTRTFLDSYVSNDSDGLIGALFTAGKDASRQSDANEVIRKRNAEIAGITKAAQQQVAGDTQDLVNLYTKQGEELPKAQRKAATAIQKAADERYKQAVADHARLKRELEQEVSMTGKDSGQSNTKFAESRRQILAAQTAKAKADSEVARLDSADATRAKALKSLQGEEPTDKEKTTQKAARKLAEDNRLSLIEGQKKMQEELQKLEDQYDKQRLDSLDKNSVEYLELKRKIDLKDLEQFRTHLIEMGQQKTGYKVLNTSTGGTTDVLNKNYKLPQADEAILKAQKDRIEAAAQTSAFEASEANSRAQFERQQALEKNTRTRLQNETELELRRALLKKDKEIVREAGESEIDYENRKAKALLQIRIDYYQKLLDLAKKDPMADSSPEVKGKIQDLEETIAEARRGIDAIDKKGKTGPTNLLQLLGLTFKDDKGNDITDQVEKQVAEATATVIEGARTILDEQLASDQARVDSIDQQLEAKQREVDTEKDLAVAGLANNLAVKKQEQAALQTERLKAQEAQRRDQAIQLGINATLQASELTLAAAKIFKSYAGLPILGQIAAIAEIAGMFIAFGATVGKIASLPKYHDGDEVTPETARMRAISGDRKPDEVDARLQVGEGVIRKNSYQSNKRLFRYLNTLERPVVLDDLAGYVRANPFGMAEGKQQQGLQQINQYYEFKAQGEQPDRELHKRVDELNGSVQQLLEETRKGNKNSKEQLPDGRFRITDERGNVQIVRYT